MRETAEAFARSWLGAFNAKALDGPTGIMSHYAEDVEHSSPTVVRVLGEPSGIVRGKPALRAYFEKALAAAPPDLHYEALRLHVGVDGLTLVYHRTGGKVVAETFHLDATGKVVRAFVAHADPVAGPRILASRHVLAVHDLRASVAFWRDALGFRVVLEPPGWSFLARDRCVMMLGECRGAMPASELGEHSYVAYLEVDDARAVHAEWSARAPESIGPLSDKDWGMREFTVRTPEGHGLTVGQELAPTRTRPSPGPR